METIRIAETDDTPGINLDRQNGIFAITGRSLPEDVPAFFEPILDWIDRYAKDPLDKTFLDIKLVYFNTSSSKAILDILLKLEDIYKKGFDVVIRWHFADDDEDMQEAGEEYADIVNIPFQQVSYKVNE